MYKGLIYIDSKMMKHCATNSIKLMVETNTRKQNCQQPFLFSNNFGYQNAK